MIDVLKTYNLKVNFSKGLFASDKEVILIENDNKSVKFNFEFEEDINGQHVLLKVKHYIGTVKEIILTINDNKAELLLTNDILVTGNLKMSISLIGTDNEILTSTEYLDNIVIKENLGDGQQPSEEELKIIYQLISKLNKAENSLINATKLFKEYEKKFSNYRVVVTEEIPELTEYELPCQYIVGNDSLEIYHNNDRLICEKNEEMNANYREVGEAGAISNQVIFGWTLEKGDILDITVKGVTSNE